MPTTFKALGRPPLARAREAAARLSSLPRAVALVYHGTSVAPRPDAVVPELAAEALAAHLRLLRARYTLVGADELLAAAARRRRGGRLPVAITFDDDLRSHLEVAAPILLEQGVPATFFLTGIGLEGGAFWWQSLQAALDRGAAAPPVSEVERLAPEERRALAAHLETLAGPDPERRALDAEEIRRLAAHGFAIGFHTRGHDRLTELDDAALAAAMRDGRAALEAAAATGPITTIAYPHGAADARVAEAAAAAGFELGFVTAMAHVTPADPPLLLNRPELLAPEPARFALDLTRIYARAR